MEPILDHILAVVPPRLDRCPVREVPVAVNIKPIVVIELRVRIYRGHVENVAHIREPSTDDCAKRELPRIIEHLVNSHEAKHFA